MKAVVFTKFGGPEAMKLIEQPVPLPQGQHVLVKVAAVGLNPVDALQRQGTMKMLQPYKFPKIAGNELSGVITALGSAATRFAVGDHVVARVDKSGLGALAEYAVIDESFIALAPRTVDLVTAATLPLAGLTAQQALGPQHLDLQPGERLLVTGGAGGVGLLAIQLGKLRGAHVTTTASPAGRQLVTELGADRVINYQQERVPAGVPDFDKVLDLVGGEALTDAISAVRTNGKVVSVNGPLTPEGVPADLQGLRRLAVRTAAVFMSRKVRKLAASVNVSFDFFFMSPDGEGLARLVSLVDAGSLKLTIDSRYPLDDYAQAFGRLESRRAKGKVIIVMPS